jgi:hypothetical protein
MALLVAFDIPTLMTPHIQYQKSKNLIAILIRHVLHHMTIVMEILLICILLLPQEQGNQQQRFNNRENQGYGRNQPRKFSRGRGR